MTLARVEAALDAGDAEQALSLLLEVWRETRDPGIGDAIDELSAQLPRELIAGGPRHRRCKQWDQIAAANDPLDVPRLLHAMLALSRREIEPRVGVIAGWPDDPRIATGLLALLEKPPQGCEGPTSERLWDFLLLQLPLVMDTRHRCELRRVAAQLPSATSGPVGDYLSARLERYVALIDDPVPLGPDDQRRRDRVLQCVRERGPSVASFSAAAELFADVHADPDDDDRRQVLADALIELGHPRGELIALQLALARGLAHPAAARSRQKLLIERHGREWLGALEPVVQRTGTRFERGFVSAVRVSARDTMTLGAADWSTVRDLDLRHWPGDKAALFASRPLRGLRRLSLAKVTLPDLDALAHADLPKLAELDLSDVSFAYGQDRQGDRRPRFLPEHHRVLWRPGAIGHHLSTLVVDTRGFIHNWIVELARGECPIPILSVVERWPAGWNLRVSRGDHGLTAAFTAGPRPYYPAPDLLAPILASAPMEMFARIEIAIPPERATPLATWAPIHDLLERWPDLEVARAPWLG